MVAGARQDTSTQRVLFTKTHPNAIIPRKSYPGDVGWDLFVLEDVTISPFEFRDISTGIAFAPPPTIWARITGRSSTIRTRDLLVVEGILDTGWRGEINFGVKNLGRAHVTIQAGERLAQLIFYRHVPIEWEETEYLPPSERSVRGFGSTGT